MFKILLTSKYDSRQRALFLKKKKCFLKKVTPLNVYPTCRLLLCTVQIIILFTQNRIAYTVFLAFGSHKCHLTFYGTLVIHSQNARLFVNGPQERRALQIKLAWATAVITAIGQRYKESYTIWCKQKCFFCRAKMRKGSLLGVPL